MSYTKCAYHNCDNTSFDVSMFRFPVHDKGRLRLWIRNSGNLFLDSLTDHELARRFICSAHFPEASIHRGVRNRLIGPAVPVNFQHVGIQVQNSGTTSAHVEMETDVNSTSPDVLKVKTPIKVYKRRAHTLSEDRNPTPSDTTSSPFETPVPMSPTRLSRKCLHEGPKKRLSRKCLFEQNIEDSPRRKYLKCTASDLLKKHTAQRARIRRLVAKCNRPLCKEGGFQSEVSKTLSYMQLRKKNDKKKWTKKEKNFSLSLFYKSPSTYCFLRRQGVVLAAPSTIRSWLAKSSCAPGFNDEIFRQIAKKFENLTLTDKACVVCFDEMSIMTDLEYSKKFDLIEGFEDLGAGRRTNKLAKYALVFVARGLYKEWELPLVYFLSNTNVNAENLQTLLNATINKLFDYGLLPKAVVCDQMSTNQKLFKTLGASCSNPFFYVNGRKIFAIFDVPHLIKNVRNNFLNNNFMYNDGEVTFKDVIYTYEIDKKSQKSRSLTKITDRHLNPNAFQKMTVSLATQIFSNSVYAAIKTAHSTGELKSDTALNTANFIKIVNDMFDGLNSGSKFDKNPNKYALSKFATCVRRAIEDGKNVFEKLKKINLKKNKAGQFKTIITRPPCFDGVVQSCGAILQLFDEETTEKKISFIMTKKLNQDVIENLFARFRQKGGCNRNPTAKLLRAIFRSNLINSLIKLPSTSNCQEEGDEFIDLSIGQPLSAIHGAEELASSRLPRSEVVGAPGCSSALAGSSRRETSDMGAPSTSSEATPVTLEQCSLNYFAGYLAKSCLNKFNNCSRCSENLINDVDLEDQNQIFILNKAYSCKSVKLKMPNENLVKLLNKSIECFNTHFKSIGHCTSVKARLFTAIIKCLECEDRDLLYNLSCKDHVEFIIKHMLLVKLNFYCKTNKRNSGALAKLRILKNK